MSCTNHTIGQVNAEEEALANRSEVLREMGALVIPARLPVSMNRKKRVEISDMYLDLSYLSKAPLIRIGHSYIMAGHVPPACFLTRLSASFP